MTRRYPADRRSVDADAGQGCFAATRVREVVHDVLNSVLLVIAFLGFMAALLYVLARLDPTTQRAPRHEPSHRAAAARQKVAAQ
jgi:hypothetical protein